MTAGGKRRVRVSGGHLAVVDVGDPEAPAVLFLHGYPTSSYLWRDFVPSVATDMRALAIDLLGAGDSGKPADAPLDPGAQARYVREVLGSLGVSRFAVVAHGDGGGIAQILADEGGVQALVLIDSAAFDAWPAGAIGSAVPASGDEPAAVVAEILRRGSARPERILPHVAEEYARPFAGGDGAGALSRWGRAIGEGPPAPLGDLRGLQAPVFLLWGEDDPFVGSDLAERLHERLETSALALLPGCGHFLPEEAGRTIVPFVVQWLAGRYLGRAHGHDHGPVLLQIERGRSEADA